MLYHRTYIALDNCQFGRYACLTFLICDLENPIGCSFGNTKKEAKQRAQAFYR